jgi:hypothetical protein
MLDQFVVLAFVWSYSLLAQYSRLGWSSAQNFIMGIGDVTNSFNMYKTITESDTPVSLLSMLSDRIYPLPTESIRAKRDNVDEDKEGVYLNYLHYFKENKFMESKNEV